MNDSKHKDVVCMGNGNVVCSSCLRYKRHRHLLKHGQTTTEPIQICVPKATNFSCENFVREEGIQEHKHRTERILCASIRRNKSRDCHKALYDNEIYDIEIGYRHCDIFHRFGKEVSNNPKDQGFYTSFGRFVDRKEGMFIAYKAHQVSSKTAFGCQHYHAASSYTEEDKNKLNSLFSEDLY